jgi:hypothetical protein
VIIVTCQSLVTRTCRAGARGAVPAKRVVVNNTPLALPQIPLSG